MSKRIVRLSESQLRNMIIRVINEQSAPMVKPAAQPAQQSAPMAKPAAQPAQQSAANDPDYKKAWGIANMLMTAIEGVGTKEPQVLQAVQSIGTKRVYYYLLQIMQKSPTVKSKTGKNYNTVMEYILEDFQIPMFDKPTRMMMARKNDEKTSGYYNDGYSKKTSTQIPKKCAEILSQFNNAELEAFSDGLSFEHDYV